MSKNPELKKANDDEIDLLDLFGRMGKTLSKWFKATGKGLLVCIIFLIRNFTTLLVSVVLGVFISYIFKWSTSPSYVSEITFRSNTVPNAEMISYINRLKLFLKEENYTGVASSLSITQEEADRINDIEAFWVIDRNYDSIPDFIDYRNNHNVYDSINVRMKDRFVVRVKLKDPRDIPQMKDRLISYVNNNPVFRRQNDFRLKMADELLARLNYDIKQLDSLQKVKYFEETRYMQPPEKGGQMIFLQEHTTQLVYGDIYALYGRKQGLDQEKNLHPEILTVISDFYQPVKRYNGGAYYGKTVIPVCLGLTLLYLIFLRNRRKLREVYRRY
jgi:hypothetical protein